MARRLGTPVPPAKRAPVKGQRLVNQKHQTSVGTRKTQRGQKENGGGAHANRPRVAPIGFSGVSLSNRFSSLHSDATATATVKPQKAKGPVVQVKQQRKGPVAFTHKPKQQYMHPSAQQKQQKMKKVTDFNRSKRQQLVNSRRNGLGPAPAMKATGNTKSAGARPGKPFTKGFGKKGIKKNDEGKGNVTGEDLDVEMDAYWHEAGKGPDPKAALLDRQMEAYWADKPKNENDSASEVKTA